MSRANPGRILPKLACVFVLGAAILTMPACGVEAGIGYSDGYGDYPPDAYIATTEPIYFGGRANYWYGGRWYYRDGGRWGHYDREPSALYQRRIQASPVRRNYESFHGRPAGGHPGGWRGGRR